MRRALASGLAIAALLVGAAVADPEAERCAEAASAYKALTGKSKAECEADFAAARGYGDLKMRVAEVTIEALAPIQVRYHSLMNDPAELDRLLARGAEQASAVAAPKLDKMKHMMGLVLPSH